MSLDTKKFTELVFEDLINMGWEPLPKPPKKPDKEQQKKENEGKQAVSKEQQTDSEEIRAISKISHRIS